MLPGGHPRRQGRTAHRSWARCRRAAAGGVSPAAPVTLWSLEPGEVPDDGVVPVGDGAERVGGVQAEVLAAGALAPPPGQVGAGLVEAHLVAAAVDAQQRVAAGVLLGRGDLEELDLAPVRDDAPPVAVGVARVMQEDARSGRV